ncbi:antitoxin Xre/MbcA/ParS toxin-binding domain-containing protein [Pseudescherichia vulneris]|uniref:type II RES/Xre toxin-antitoxin system antitoxin n=1 Tax=Pseudescherichia vulneris TaxID=566 RepID=UPI0028D064C5|nr:antitoxin Xre/MbcA/ParS toxin-binding domain-containing protein [Pseudescherichia vulneris]
MQVYTPKAVALPHDLFSTLGLPVAAIAAHDSISAGLDATILRSITDATQLDEALLLRMAGIDRNTYSRRLNSAEKRFSPEQSARVYTLARVISAARELFNDDNIRLAQWLNKPAKGLGGKKPAELLSTPAGAEAVLTLIGRLEHGVLS